jgi:molecular chaperone DnaJ
MSKKDFYKVLGVSKNATPEEIKKSYKRLARQHHPDRNPGNKGAEDKFKSLSEAYSVLSHPEKRKQYDLFGSEGPMGSPGPGSRPGGGQRAYAWSGGPGEVNFEEIFGGGGGGMGDLFSDLFGGGGRRKGRGDFRAGPEVDFESAARPGRDLEAEITIRFEDAIKGGTHTLEFSREDACAECGGSGRNKRGRSRACAACGGQGRKQVAGSGGFNVVCGACEGTGKVYAEACHACSGQGVARVAEKITVKIPPGVNDGGRLRIPGKGETGSDGRAGTLFLHIRVLPHPFFRREGRDLHLEVPITVSEAALGAKIEVPTLEGKATVKVAPGAQQGAVLRLKGKGAPHPKGGAAGDLMVHLQVVAPERPDEETRRLLEELKKLEPNPRAGMFQ